MEAYSDDKISPTGKIKENNIIVGENEYAGTPGLWELIVMIKFSPMGVMIIMQK